MDNDLLELCSPEGRKDHYHATMRSVSTLFTDVRRRRRAEKQTTNREISQLKTELESLKKQVLPQKRANDDSSSSSVAAKDQPAAEHTAPKAPKPTAKEDKKKAAAQKATAQKASKSGKEKRAQRAQKANAEDVEDVMETSENLFSEKE